MPLVDSNCALAFQPKLITFDCANTLIWTDWQPHTFALRCALIAGLELPSGAGEAYMKLFLPKLAAFWQVNQERSLESWRAFWVQQVEEWLVALGIQGQDALALHMIGEREIFETPSHTFKLFDDTIPALESTRSLGVPMAILSNWDHSLHGCVAAHGLTGYFQSVFASLEHGVEKPDAGFFRVALDHFNVAPEECLHIGDDSIDDIQGAEALGMPCLLIDRSQSTDRDSKRISSLSEVLEAVSWFD
jgi:HAD superfamily hydrolase (TIGR01549 family)